MRDLVAVFKILNVCTDRIEDHPIYIEPMCEILKVCSLPFLKEKTSDETSYEQIAIEAVAQLGEWTFDMIVSNKTNYTHVHVHLYKLLERLSVLHGVNHNVHVQSHVKKKRKEAIISYSITLHVLNTCTHVHVH